jgi:hypothetical protein
MRLVVNKVQQEYNASSESHRFDRQEINTYHRSYMARTHDGRRYRRAHVTHHDIQKYYFRADSDTGRSHADSRSSDFRGYETIEF